MFWIVGQGEYEGEEGFWVEDDENGEEGFIPLDDEEAFWAIDEREVFARVPGRCLRWPKKWRWQRRGKGKRRRGVFRSYAGF